MTKKYKFHISSWKEGKYFAAYCLDVGVSSLGNTRKKALDNLAEALDLYIDEKHPPIMKLESVRSHTLTIASIDLFNAERDNNGKGIYPQVLIDMIKKIDFKAPRPIYKKS